MSYIHYGLLIALAIALLFAAATDIRSRTIQNKLNIFIAISAPIFWWASGMSFWPDIAWQAGFALVACALLVGIAWIGYKAGIVILGGGDIKLLGALSLWFAPLAYLNMLIVMAVFGGAMAVGFVLRRVIFKPKKYASLPYGVAIAFGALWVLLPQLTSIAASA